LDSAKSRDAGLDGLRGVAACVVVLGHVLVASSAELANGQLIPGGNLDPTVNSVLLYTPLHLFWAGREAVVVFFVLSGFVLAAGPARGRPFEAARYYPHRLLRLYLPVWGALLLAWGAHLLVRGDVGGTWWLDAHTDGLSTHAAIQDVFLLGGAGTFALLGVLWSLHWEVVFSLLLPLFLLLGWTARRALWVGVALAVAVMLIGGRDHQWAQFLPSFMLGTLLAFGWEDLAALRGRRLVTPALVLVSVLGLTAPWWIRLNTWVVTGHREDAADRIALVLTALGACAALLLPLMVGRARELLEARPVHYLGTRSFSLYLVHEPVVVVAAFALGGSPTTLALAVTALPAALLLTEGFYRLVERPSHLFARRVGAATARMATAPFPASASMGATRERRWSELE
jgi:peptidoglycan/LPS O-acetylase OafA/YrhL